MSRKVALRVRETDEDDDDGGGVVFGIGSI